MQKWKPCHTCQVVMTNVTMLMFVPAIAARANVCPQITLSPDTTHKLFVCKGFCLLILFVHDASLSAKIVGFCVTCAKDTGDYYFTTHVCRNMSEWVSSLSPTDLPGGVADSPFNLPSPPPCSQEFPLKFNMSTNKLEHNHDYFVTMTSRRFQSRTSKESRKKVTGNALHFPKLIPDKVEGSFHKTF